MDQTNGTETPKSEDEMNSDTGIAFAGWIMIGIAFVFPELKAWTLWGVAFGFGWLSVSEIMRYWRSRKTDV
jgi:hypothetical protein